MSAFGALLGIGGSLLGGMLDGDGGVGDANAANAALNQRINSLFNEQRVRNRLGFIESNKRFKERIGTATDTLDRSEADIRGISRGSKQAVHDNAQRQTAAAGQSLVSKGLLNSSVGAGAQRAIAADSQRQLSGIDAQQSGLLSQLGQRRAGLISALEGDYANLPFQETNQGMNLTSMFTNALGQQGSVAAGSSGQFAEMGGGLGSLLGGLFGNGEGFF